MAVINQQNTSYSPLLGVAAAAVLFSFAAEKGIVGFFGFFLALLGVLKILDQQGFLRAFLLYDSMSPKFPAYGKLYPFIELLTGLGFVAESGDPLTGLVALLAGTVGLYSIYQARYVEGKNMNRASAGSGFRAPLGAVGFTENLIMAAMGAWFLFS